MTTHQDWIEKVASAWASIDGKDAQFDVEKGRSLSEEGNTGTYEGYMVEAEELLKRSGLWAHLGGE